METLTVLLALCEGNPPVISRLPYKVQQRESLVFFMYTWINGWTNSRVPVIWGAIMFSRIIIYYLGTVHISPSSVSAWHSLSWALRPLRLMKQSTLLQIMHFAGSTLVDFLCSVDGLLANLVYEMVLQGWWSVIRYSIKFRPFFRIR